MADRWATFDCYGTLIDWERGLGLTLGRLWPDADVNQLIARFHEVEPVLERDSSAPYREVLLGALMGLASAEGLDLRDDETDALARALPSWLPFPEVPGALDELKRRGWRVAILSNTDPDLLDASIRRIGVDVDVRVTVADAGSYKPAPGHWERFFAATGASRESHVHVGASLFHDIEPAAKLGLTAVWINRAGRTTTVPHAAELPDLDALPDALDRLVPA